jgi:hypothetical protein
MMSKSNKNASEPDMIGFESTIDMENRPKTVCSRKGILTRENMSLDDKCFFDMDTPSKKSASENMIQYMQNFGLSFALPSIYVQDGKFFPQDPRYSL